MNYIHRNIKPEHFRVDNNGKVYIIDFSKAIKYVQNGEHIKQEKSKNSICSLTYTSISSHSLRNKSRKDDLEGLGYCLLSLYTENKIFWLSDQYSD